MDEKDNKQQGLQIELPQEVAQGEYANFAIITHGSSDFVVDFARVLPGVPKARVCSRIVLAPEHAKRLLGALQENILRYEKEFGPIRIPNQCDTKKSSALSVFPIKNHVRLHHLTSQKERLESKKRLIIAKSVISC